MSDRSNSDLAQDDRWRAAQRYEQAIQRATDRGNSLEAAIAYERAARFYIEQEMPMLSCAYLREARDCYLRGGETDKGRELEAKHPEILGARAIAPEDECDNRREETAVAQLSIAQLMQLEKMAALGQLIAGIAHEIKTPLGAIRASSGNTLRALEGAFEQFPLLGQRLSLPQQSQFFDLLARSLHNQTQRSSREKRQLKRSLMRQCQAANLNNAQQIADTLLDMGFDDRIDPFLALLKISENTWMMELAYNLSRLQHNTQNILTAVERVAKIVSALKTYARHDSTGDKQWTQICQGIDTVLELYHNPLKQGITVNCHYKSLPSTCCYPDELIQVWTNLVHNAIQAMGTEGTLEIAVEQKRDRVFVAVTDSGCGIPPEIQPRIFDPFFTTKPVGEGNGLGLDIVKKIIDKHNGTIEVESVPGRTTFTITLPSAEDCTLKQTTDPLNGV